MTAELRTHTPDGEITLPSTIRDIRAALPEGQRQEFADAIDDATVHTVHAVARSWLMEVLEQRDPQMSRDLDDLRHQEQVRRRRGGQTA